MIPKQHIATLSDVGPEHQALLGRMMVLAPRLMRELGVTNGFRTVDQHRRGRRPGGAAPAHARHGRPAPLGIKG